jgi:hypothetical protein
MMDEAIKAQKATKPRSVETVSLIAATSRLLLMMESVSGFCRRMLRAANNELAFVTSTSVLVIFGCLSDETEGFKTLLHTNICFFI